MPLRRKTIGVAVIGAGMRSQACCRQLLTDAGGRVKVLSVFDPDRAMSEQAVKNWNAADALLARTYRQAIHAPGVEWVLVFPPNAFHREHIVEGFRAGKHVFSEKPIATTIADCAAIYRAHHASGRQFGIGSPLAPPLH